MAAQVVPSQETGHTRHPLAPCNSFVNVSLHRYTGGPNQVTQATLSLHAIHLSMCHCTGIPGDQIRARTPPSRFMQFICQGIIAQVYRGTKPGHAHHPLAPCSSFVNVSLHRYTGGPNQDTHTTLSLHAIHLSMYHCTGIPGDQTRARTPPSRFMQFICQCIIAQVYRGTKPGHAHHPLAPCNSFVNVSLHRYTRGPNQGTHTTLSLHATHLSVYDCTCKPGDRIGHTRHPLAPCNSLGYVQFELHRYSGRPEQATHTTLLPVAFVTVRLHV